MRVVGIVETGLVSGSNYNGEGVSDIDALKTSKSLLYSVRATQRTPSVWIKTPSLLPMYVLVAVYCGKMNN
jgi:hypothetical protein